MNLEFLSGFEKDLASINDKKLESVASSFHTPGRNKVNKVGGRWVCINSTKVFN
jgi:hypothetical protein